MALVVLSLATVRGARAAVRGFKARTPGLLALLRGAYGGQALACLLAAAPATAQVDYAVSNNPAYVANSFPASGAIVIASTDLGYPVTSIEESAFSGCSAVTSVIIPKSVTTIGFRAFLVCTSLTNFSGEAANPAYSSLDGVLFDKAQMTLIAFPLGRGDSYVIPNRVSNIVDRAFSGCTGLTNVIIGNRVTSSGGSAFNHSDRFYRARSN